MTSLNYYLQINGSNLILRLNKTNEGGLPLKISV